VGETPALSTRWIANDKGEAFIYYGSSDARMQFAASSLERLLDYAINTPPDPLSSAACVRQRIALVDANLRLAGRARP
jgi:4-O-beta-D-mannosyl-D-glucose phosphorylase